MSGHRIFFSISTTTLLLAGMIFSTPASVSAATCVTITYTLQYGSTDDRTNGEVSLLQNFLILNEPTGVRLSVTGLFDSATQIALANWQRREGIVSSGTPATTGYGAVGPRTRAAIANCARVTPTPAPIPTPTPVPTPSPAPTPSGTLYRSLSYGSYGSDVSTLQLLLSVDPLVYPEAIISGFFGRLTEAAVQRYQAKYNIVSYGSPATTGYGAVGPRTRTSLLSGGTIPVPGPIVVVNPPVPPPIPPPTNSCVLDGVVIPDGASSTFYSTRDLPAGTSCDSRAQLRTCIGGTLSGEEIYRYVSCSTGVPVSCSLGGVSLENGASITAYQSSSLPFGSTCVFESRMCTNGVLSGSYTNTSCQVATPVSCSIDGITIAHGSSRILYSRAGVSFGESCSTFSQTRTCTNGVLSGSTAYQHSSCAVGQPLVCSFNGTTVQNASSITAYQSATVPFGSTCVSQSRTCSNGVLSGIYSYSSCAVASALSCTFNGSPVVSGTSVTAYQSSSVPFGGTCVSQPRTCTNGVLSGTYTNNSCIVSPASACVLNGVTTVSGASRTYYSVSSVPFGQTCTSVAQTRTCTNGVLSGSYTNISCTTQSDTTAPTVSLTAPVSGATLSGTVPISANASDATAGVAGVTFKADGIAIGSEDTSSPYSVSWNTTSIANGAHTLTATARDVAGNRATSTESITVTNSIPLSVTNNNPYTTAQCAAYFSAGGNQSQWAYVQNNVLNYKTVQPNGDRIPDFSYAGYHAGGVAIPTVPVMRTVISQPGDDTARIQAAINEVSGLPLVNGSRGAVLLGRGHYQISGTLNINASGVVLRGSGSAEGGTDLIATGTPHLLINIEGSRTLRASGLTAHITDSYVPAGARSFHVDNPSTFVPGDTIYIYRPVTSEWIAFMGMDTLVRDGNPQSWLSPGSILKYERTITNVQGFTITVDLPLTDSINAAYTGTDGATIRHISSSGDISEVGIESLKVEAPVLIVPIDQPLFTFMHVDSTVDGWVRDVIAQDFESGIKLDSWARRITLDTVTFLRTVQPTLGGGKPADFQIDGNQNLVMRSSALSTGVISYTTQSLVTMNVLYDSRGSSAIDPHQRWATGLLVDRTTGNDGIYMRNSGVLGSGHGWTIGNGVIWNSVATEYTVQKPPGSQNWAIGVVGTLATIHVPGDTTVAPISIVDSPGTPVAIPSLYLAQLCERLGPGAVSAILQPVSNTTSMQRPNVVPPVASVGASNLAHVLEQIFGFFEKIFK